MRRRNKRKICTFIIVFLLIDLVAIMTIFNVSNARYESDAVAETELDVALFAISETDNYTITLDKMVPREDPYVYRFSVSNTDENGKLTDVKMKYNLRLIATTNLPLEYKLYLNQNYLSPTARDILTLGQDEIIPDEYGTFFRVMTTPEQRFVYSYTQTYNYTLLVYFPDENDNKDSKYQDQIENIRIEIDAKQLVDGE